ncbi:MAG: Cof-type HAD-IIB family hydrolase [Eubacterium sp.]|nr:Cof-type HAD-IIB family hydrolase [Eubacterium sp.]
MKTPSDIRLIAFDLDGTLLTEKKELTPRTRTILERLSDQGITLLPTTGRALSGIPDAVKALSGATYALTSNGAGVYHRLDDSAEPAYELMFEIPMNHDRTIALMTELSELEVMPDPFIKGSCYMVKSKSHLIDRMAVTDSMKAYIRSSRTLIEDMPAFLQDKDVQKITINFATGEDGHRIDLDKVKHILERYPEFVNVTGGIRNIEVSDKNATKGDAMLRLADHLGIRADQIIAFGDSENDITMLQAAGIGVAMANALDITKEAADEITLTNDEEGVAVWLEEMFS